jgi:hypothetical protein
MLHFAMTIKLALAAALALTFGTASAQGGSGSATGVTPNYKPGGGKTSTSKPKGKNVITRSGGQGTNSGSDPKGKIVLAPTTGPAHPNKRTTSTNPQPNAH